MLKLNGGLGTGMGLEKAKSLLEVTGGLTFLDLIAKQVSYGTPHGCRSTFYASLADLGVERTCSHVVCSFFRLGVLQRCRRCVSVLLACSVEAERFRIGRWESVP